jgi:uncharacterized protein (TIGR02246 family)
MQRILIAGIVLLLSAALYAGRSKNHAGPLDRVGQDQQPNAAASDEADGQQPPEISADEAAIRANVEAFVKAYNAGDAAAAAALFLPEGQIIGEEGEIVEGREAITERFAAAFEEDPEMAIDVFVASIRFIGSELALEVGSTAITTAPGETPVYERYTVLHVKRDGKWSMAVVRDAPGEPPTNHERLEPLAWLVGDWIDEGDESVVATSCRWSEDGNFLLQDLDVRVEGDHALRVTQRIGWDPVTKRIRSWVFDNEGGFSEGVWARSGDQWIIKITGVRNDGASASATNTITPVTVDRYVWSSHDRIVGSELSAPMEITVVRKPPDAAPSK